MAYKTGEDVDYIPLTAFSNRAGHEPTNYFTVRREAGRCGPCDHGMSP